MRRSRRFAVNVFGSEHERFAKHATAAEADRFSGVNWQLGHAGIPLLSDALACLEL
jgi:flavin reductase (DIM6/NTAB) family NADH-FMN oxidoreductase RutF